MKKIIILILLIIVSLNLFSEIPHPVYIEILSNDLSIPGINDITFTSWISYSPDDPLTELSLDCYYGAYGNYIKVNCGNFQNWDPADTLCLDVLQISTGQIGYGEYILNNENNQTFQIGDGGIILEPFYPLVLSLPSVITFNEDEEEQIDINQYMYAENADDLTLSFTVMQHLSMTIDSLMVTLVPDPEWSGTEYCIFTLDDNMGNVVDDSVNFVVNPINDPPLFSIPDEEYYLDEDSILVVDFSSYYSDIDSDILTLSCTGNTNIEIQIESGIVTFIPVVNWNGTEQITFIVNDGDGRAIATDDVEVIVNPVNDPPCINLPEDITFLAEEEVYSLDLTGMIWDIDEDEINIYVTGNQSITPEFDGLLVTFNVAPGWHGSESLIFSVDDNVQRAVASDTILVNILTLSDTRLELPEIIIDDGESVNINLTISTVFEEWSVNSFDFAIEYDPYVLSWEDFSQENSIVSSGNIQVYEEIPGFIEISYFYYLPISGQGLLLQLDFDTVCFGESTLDIQDAVFNDTELLNAIDGSIMVNDIGLEHAPVAIAGPDQIVDELSVVQLDGTASFDPDGDNITYQWSGPPEIMFADQYSAMTTFIAPDVNEDTEYLINLVCNDGSSNSQPDMLVITVNYVNHPPQIELPDNFTFYEDSLLTVDFTEFISDIDPDDLTLSAENSYCIDVDIEDFIVTFSAVENWSGSELIVFYIDDNQNRLTDSDEVNVIVEEVNDAPVADAGSDQQVHDGALVTLDASASYDIENDNLTFVWVAPQGIVLDDPYAVTPSFNAPQVIDPGEYTFILQVSDDRAREMDTDEVIITVIDDDPVLPQVELLPENQARFYWLPPGSAGSGEELEQGFEGPIVPQGWTNIDNDGDGFGWYVDSTSPHSGSNCIVSASYFNNSSLTPDNWLITPVLEIGALSTLSFWIAAEDEFYPEEHYSIKISTSGTNPLDFSDILWEETLADNQWNQHSFSLTPWAGQSIYIAFVHHDCTDQLLLKLDDVQVFNENARQLNGYNVYLDDEYQAFSENCEFIFEDVFGEHSAGVEAVYDSTVSEMMIVDFDHTAITIADVLPEVTRIQSVFPNPFNPLTCIKYQLAQEGEVNIAIYNLKGQKICTLVNEYSQAGVFQTIWNAKYQASGIYLIRIKTNNSVDNRKIILLK